MHLEYSLIEHIEDECSVCLNMQACLSLIVYYFKMTTNAPFLLHYAVG